MTTRKKNPQKVNVEVTFVLFILQSKMFVFLVNVHFIRDLRTDRHRTLKPT